VEAGAKEKGKHKHLTRTAPDRRLGIAGEKNGGKAAGAAKAEGGGAGAAEIAGGGSKGQRKSTEQRQRPPRLREGAARGKGSRRSRGRGRRGCGRGQQGAKKVAGAEAEAAKVAGGGSKGKRKSPEQRQSRGCGRGSKGQRKSPEQRQRPPRLREGQQGAEEVAGAEAEAAEVAGGGSKGQRKSPEQRHLLSLPQRAVADGREIRCHRERRTLPTPCPATRGGDPRSGLPCAERRGSPGTCSFVLPRHHRLGERRRGGVGEGAQW
jgi:hypothetical protein